MNRLTPDEEMVLERVIAKPELQPHFFSKVKQLKWFDALKEKGLLEPSLNPHPVNTEGDYWNIPSWPVTEYLVRSSEMLLLEENVEYAKAYMVLIREVTAYAKENKYSNHRTWWQFSKILRLLPAALVTPDDIGLVDFWLDDRFDRYMVARELGKWLEQLLDAPDEHTSQLAMLLLDKLFVVDEVDSKYDANKKSPTLRIDNYWARELVKKVASKAAITLGLQVVELFENKLRQALDINGNDKWSVIWRRAIEEHVQNNGRDDGIDILLQSYRDALLAQYRVERENVSEAYLANALDSKYQVIQRTAIYVASETYNHLDSVTSSKIIVPVFFNDNYRHELWTLLNKNFAQFDEKQKQATLKIIENIVFLDDDGKIEVRPTAYRKSVWYSAIKEHDASANDEYSKCVAITGKEPEHPEFSSYSSVRVGVRVRESPVSLVDLNVMLQEPEKMVTFLNEYDHVGHFGEVGIEGLVKVFGELVEVESEHILNHSKHLLQLKPHYQHEIFSAFDKSWSDKKTLNWTLIWPELLEFAQELLRKDEFWNSPTISPHGAFIGNSNWVVSKLGQLIEAGCKKDEHAFGVENIGLAKAVLELILQRQSGEEFVLDSDAVSVAINSSRGRCLEAYVNLALYECRNLNGSDDAHIAAWQAYEPVFSNELTKPGNNEYEFSVLATMYLSNFLYLSKDWLSANLELIFGEVNSQRWLCAIQGYNYANGFNDDVYSLFKQKLFFENLLDSPHLNDETKGHYIERVCLYHLWEKEQLGAEGDPLSLLLKRGNYAELSKVVWWFWSVHDEAQPKSKEVVFNLWPALIKRVTIEDKEGQLLAAKLCLWIAYIETLDTDTISWLSVIAPYAGKDYNADTFLEGLARLSTASPLEVANIWKLMLTKYSPVYADDSIRVLFENLIKSGADGQRTAKEIADLYLKHGASGIVNIYRQSVTG
ncbi:hypothetical protein E5115_001281 [Vibrio mimicus]